MTARADVIAAFETIVADDPGLAEIDIIRSARNVGEPGKRVRLIFKTDRYAPTAAAPRRNVTWTGTATLVSPHRDQDKAEDQLETLLDTLIPYLSGSLWMWESADLVGYGEQLLALDIRLSAIFQKQ
jgi:hypothetical protein